LSNYKLSFIKKLYGNIIFSNTLKKEKRKKRKLKHESRYEFEITLDLILKKKRDIRSCKVYQNKK
jgi:hypothetical protein